MALFRAFLVLCLVTAGSLFGVTAIASGQTVDNEVEVVVGTVESQTYQDGPNGTVFTLTKLASDDGKTRTIRTHGGIRSDGIGQHTSHQAEFEVGESYRVSLVPSAEGPPTGEPDRNASPLYYSVLGGHDGAVLVDEDGGVIQEDSTPDNYVLQPYSWAWTLPDNPPVYTINPNTADVEDEVALIQAAFDVWEDDPDSEMVWAYGGTTAVASTGDDGVNAVYWADTPDVADDFLARSTTFYIPSSGRALSTDIMFNNDYNWTDGSAPGAFDIITVAIHESGHSLGLSHAPDNAAIMYFSVSDNTTKRELSLGDRGGVAALYPSASVTAVSGRVGFTDGAAAPDVKLNLFTENRAQFVGVTFSDAAGNYGFELDAPGCYVVTFIAPEGVNFAATGNGFQNRPFCAEAGQTIDGIDALLVAPGFATTSAGRVTFSDGSAAAGVKLNLFTENRASFIGFTTTDNDGDYSFDLLGAGCYVTTFIAPDGDTFTTSGGRFQNVAYCAEEGETVTGIDAELVGAASQANIGGQVANADGSGEPNVKIVLYRAAADGSRGPWVGPAFTDGVGNYSFSVGGGCYVLDFVAPDGRTWASSNGPFQQVAACVEAGESNDALDGVLN